MGKTTWRLTVDQDRCAGSGLCAATAPGHFRLSAGKSRPLSTLVEPDDTLIDVAELCPREAITVHDAAGILLAPTE
jgi:ferredoxin